MCFVVALQQIRGKFIIEAFSDSLTNDAITHLTDRPMDRAGCVDIIYFNITMCALWKTEEIFKAFLNASVARRKCCCFN